jgi:hypothetical protein
MRRSAYLGRDSVYYCENSAGHVFITTPESHVPEGYVRKCAETVTDVENFWRRMDTQERHNAEQMNFKMYEQRKERMAAARSKINARRSSGDCSALERKMLDDMLGILDRKEEVLQSHSVYGVSAMQERAEPLPPSTTKKVVLTDA